MPLREWEKIQKVSRSIILSLLCFLSGCSLVLAFPPLDQGALAWIGLVPLLTALDGERPRKQFGIGFLTGLFFFLGSLFWLRHVTWVGLIILCLYLALYFALFAVWAGFISTR